MASVHLGGVVRHIHKLAGTPRAEEGPDDQLLQGFIARRDEAAFAALVRRHGPMVLGVCRSVLGPAPDAEDVCQATFLLLAGKAAAIRRRGSLASWLHGVAYRLALKTRARSANRRRHETRAGGREQTYRMDDMTWRELRQVLHEELSGLAEKYRAPVVLCYLEGKTVDEAARQLGWAKGTLKGRLERARDLLRTRLARRGLAPGATLLATLLSQETAAALPAALAGVTARAAAQLAAGASAGGVTSEPVARIVATGLSAGRGTTLKSAAVLVMAAGLVAAAGVLAGSRGEPDRGPPESARRAAPLRAPVKSLRSPQAKGLLPAERDEDRPIAVTGRVVDRAAKPVAAAQVALLARPKRPGQGGDLSGDQNQVLGQTRADGEGRFRLSVANAFGEEFWEVFVLAGARGHGLGWQRLTATVRQAEVAVTLPAEQVLRGRLVDVQGQPAAGVQVHLTAVGQAVGGDMDGVRFWSPPRRFPLWPGPVTTDAQGRFVLPGVNLDQGVGLQVRDDRFAPQWLNVKEFQKAKGREVQLSLAPSHLLEGRVLYGDSGKPVPGGRLTVYAGDFEGGGGTGIDGRADAQGRFRLNPWPGKYLTVTAYAPDGQPYLATQKILARPRAAVKQTVDIKLVRGVLVRGKVTEASSGKPVAGAGVQFMPRDANNPNLRDDVITGWQGAVVSGKDGVFRIAVLPGPGHLLVSGPTADYIHREVGENEIQSGKPGGTRLYPDGLVKLDIPAKGDAKEVAVTLRRGVTVRGRLVGPDGKPVARALMIHRLTVTPFTFQWSFPAEVGDGRFEVRGCDPEQTYPVYFLDPKNRWGATVTVAGKQAGGKPLTVQLAPCGQAVARFVDPRGKPVPGHRPMPLMVVTPGPTRRDLEAFRKGLLFADEGFLANIDRVNHWKDPGADAQGRHTLTALIPGATYRITAFELEGPVVKKEFTAEAGKTVPLGDITVRPAG
jgi:RNA polymerase sigma factor (sigma-70 family)